MKKFLLLTLMTCSAIATYAGVVITNSQGVEITYDINLKDEYATVLPSEGVPYTGVVAIPENVSYEGKTIPVKVIADKAFYACKSLTTITIPKTITRIGGHAFKGCVGLTTVNYNATNCVTAAGTQGKKIMPAFEDCISISMLNLGGDVVSIPEYIFWGCTGITELTIPEYVTSIGGRAFCDCKSLSVIKFDARDCKTLGSKAGAAFMGSPITNVVFGPYVTSIPDYAFKGCNTLTQITIPEQVTSIGAAAFYDCPSLTTVNFNATECNNAYKAQGQQVITAFNNPAITTVNFGQKVHNIPNYLFYGCSGITDLVLSPTTETIGECAFLNCSSISQVTIPETVTSIGGRAFGGCSNLTTIYFNAINCVNATTYNNNVPIPAFENSSLTTVVFGKEVKIIPDNAFSNCKSLKNIQIPDEVKQIGTKAFYNCSSLPSVTIPENVTSIGGLAFAGCDNLATLNFNARRCTGVTKVEKNITYSAFQNCGSIKTVTIGNEVEILPEYMFAGCSGLTKINIPKSVKQIGKHIFDGCSGLNTIDYNAERCEIFSDPNAKRSIFSNEALTGVNLGPDVKEIPNYAFAGCNRLANITIPANTEVIGKYAFQGCTGLKKITIPENVRNIGGGAFEGCSSMMDITFNATNCINMKTIEKGVTIAAFMNTPATRITIGPKVEQIPDFAFYGCTMTNEIKWGKSLKKIGAMSFAHVNGLNELTIPEGITAIGGGAFSDCENLITVNFNAENCVAAFSLATDSTIYPFGGKNKINNVNFGKKVKFIPEGLFYGCSMVKLIEIPANVTGIGALAFANCTALANVYFNAVQCEVASGTINGEVHSAFEGCTALAGFAFDDKVTAIPPYLCKDLKALARASIGEKSKCKQIGAHAFENCENLRNIRISEYIDIIGDYALFNTGINKFTVHSFMKEIGVGAIGACRNLSNVTCKKDNDDFIVKNGILYTKDMSRVIVCPPGRAVEKLAVEEGTTTIDDGAFKFCSKIREVVLPASVNYIGKEAFFNCTGLRMFIVPSPSMPICPGAIFDKNVKANSELKCGPGLVSEYLKHEYWKGFKNTGESFAPTYEIKYEYEK